jgi:hypothetical protein
MANTNLSSRALLWVGIGFLALGLPLLGFGAYFWSVAASSADWNSTSGKVVRTGVQQSRSRAGKNSSGSPRYNYTVEYRYTVDNRVYLSSQFSLGEGQTASDQFDSEAEARNEALQDYPAGKGGASLLQTESAVYGRFVGRRQ